MGTIKARLEKWKKDMYAQGCELALRDTALLMLAGRFNVLANRHSPVMLITDAAAEKLVDEVLESAQIELDK